MTEINFTYAEGTSFEEIRAFEVAGALWSNHLQDDATINIHVELSDQLPENVIGGALPGISANEKYKDVRDSLIEDETSANDAIAVKDLPKDKGGKLIVSANTDNDIKVDINVTTANAKALGLIDEHASQLDGYILINDLSSQSDYTWDTDTTRTSEPVANSLDLLSVATHEVGHILGFVSGVDSSGWLNVVLDGQDDKKGKIKDNQGSATPLDLFRYTDSGKGAKPDLTIGVNDDGDTPYFSLDGGDTSLANFSSGKTTELGGDGYQASHWQYDPNNPVGILDPALAPEARRTVSSLDLTALDVIGWDVDQDPVEIDYEVITAQAEQALADRLEVDVDWLQNNADNAALRLGEDQLEQVVDLIESSEVYEWGVRQSSWSTRWAFYFNEIAEVIAEEGLFATFDGLPPAQSGSGPDDDVVLGLNPDNPVVGNNADTPSPAPTGGNGSSLPQNNIPSGATFFGGDSSPNQFLDATPNVPSTIGSNLGSSSGSDNSLLPSALPSDELPGLATDPLLVQGAQAILASFLGQ